MESSASWKYGVGSLLQSGFLDHECQGFVSAGIISLPYLLCNAALQSSSVSRMNNVIKAHVCVHNYHLPGKLLWQILYRLIGLQVLVSCFSRNQSRDTSMEILGHTGVPCVFFPTDAVHMEKTSANVYKCLFVGVYLLQLFVPVRFLEWLSALEQPSGILSVVICITAGAKEILNN